MSSIHYKFKATLEYKTLVFDGLHISVNDLKKEICEKENIKAESFDLLLTNAHTKRQYSSDELIPRNSSVIVQRTPRDNAAKLPKVQDTTNSGVIARAAAADTGFVAHIEAEQFNKMTEEERLAHVKAVSASKYQPANFQKRSSILTGPPPPTYLCNRCSQPGHWYKNCPMLNTRRTTGITMDELMETTADDPLAMLHPSGKFVVPIMHWKARQQKKVESAPVSETENRVVPAELSCPLCNQLLRDAVLATCCGDSFCAECVQQQLLDSSNAKCPGANCSQTAVSADKLVPNLKMRQAVESFKSGLALAGGASSASKSSTLPVPEQTVKASAPRAEDTAPAQVPRVRIGLSNRSVPPSQPPPPVQQPVSVATPQPPVQTEIQPTPPMPAQRPPVVNVEVEPAPPKLVAPPAPQVTAPLNLLPSVPLVPAEPPRLPRPVVPLPPMPVLPVNVHQPPPGYVPIQLPAPPRASSDSAIHSRPIHSTPLENVVPTSTPSTLIQRGVQPPPPGLTAATSFPAVAAPPPIKDAWDEFLERREEKDRQRAAASRSRHRRSTRSSSYSSTSSSSQSSSESRSRSRSWSRERSARDRARNSRERRNVRRKASRSPARIAYPTARLHPPPAFGLYQHPPPGPFPVPPSATYSHHRLPTVVSSFPPPSFVPVPANPLPNYPQFANAASYPGSYRSVRTYVDDRNTRKRSPRYNEPDRRTPRRRSTSREREGERRERARVDRNEDFRKFTRDIDERIRPEEKPQKKFTRDIDERIRPRELRELKEPRYTKHSGGGSRRRREKDEPRTEETSKVVIEKEPVLEDVSAEATIAEVLTVETRSPEPVAKSNEVEAAVEDIVMEKEISVEEVGAKIREEAEESVSAGEPENGKETENAGGSDVHTRSEKKRKKRKKLKRKHKREERDDDEKERKKRHRHHADGDAEEHERHRKSKKHKRTREEKEKKKEEKERRREERRRRRKTEGEASDEKEGKVNHDEVRVRANGEEERAAEDAASLEPSSFAEVRNKEEENKMEGDGLLSGASQQGADVKSRSETRKDDKEVSERDAVSLRVEEESKCEGRTSGMEYTEAGAEEKKTKAVRNKSEERVGRRERDSSSKGKEKRTRVDDECEGKKTEMTDDIETRRRVEKYTSSDSASRSSKHSDRTRSDYRLSKEGHEGRSRIEGSNDSRISRESDKDSKERLERVRSSDLKPELSDEKRADKRKLENERADAKRSRDNAEKSEIKAYEKKTRDEERKLSAKSDSSAPKSEKIVDKPSKPENRKPSQRKEKEEADREGKKEKDREAERKRLDEIKISIEKELAGDRKVETVHGSDGRKEKPNITVEVKGEKRVTRENVFESSVTSFNARQKIKMILLPETERFAGDKAKKKTTK